MLKKSGGLAFKPKAGRRGGTGPAATAPSSQAPSTSASATGTPVAEPSTGTPTPTPAPALAPAPIVPEVPETTPPSSHETAKLPVPETRQPTARPETEPEPEPSVVSQPTPEPTNPPPRPTVEPLPEPISVPEDTSALPRSQDTSVSNTDPALDISTTTSARKPLPAAPGASTTENPATSEPSTGSAATSTRLPTAPPSPPPVPDTITAVAPPSPPASSAASAPTGEPSSASSAPKKRAPRKRKAPVAEGEAEAAAAPRKKRAPRKQQPAVSAPAGDGEATTTEGGQEIVGVEEEEGAPRPKKKPSRGRKAPPTPEDAEKQQVDHSTTKMGELIRDLGIGKPFKHADAVAERARQARHEAKLRKLEKQKRALGLLPAGEEGRGDAAGSRAGTPAEGRGGGPSAAVTAPAAVDTGGGVGYEVVDGQIVVNQNTLVVDRHAAAQHGSLETVEEDEFSHLTTAASYRRASRAPAATANAWTDEETERFYRLLGMFGCDFESIAAMLPGKNRRMIKCKFNREERLRPRRVNAAVMVRGAKPVGIDIEEYKGFQRATWQDTDDIAREHERLAREQREDIRRLRRERREAGLVDGESDNEDGEGGAEQQESAPLNPSGMPTPMEIENEVPAAG